MEDFKNADAKLLANQLYPDNIRNSNWLKAQLKKHAGLFLNAIFARLRLLHETILPRFRFVHQKKIDGKESFRLFFDHLEEALADLLRKKIRPPSLKPLIRQVLTISAN